MTGWQWCPGAHGWCRECRKAVTGLWKFWTSQDKSTISLCADCAGGTEVVAA